MGAEATLFGSTSDAPTVPLSNSRALLRWGQAGLTVFFHTSDSRIRAAHSEDGGLSWVPPFDVAIDGTEQFTAVASGGLLHLFYVTPARGVKHLTLRPGEVPQALPETAVIYMNHEETGDPAFPCAQGGPDGALHLACSFRRSTGWSVLYRRVEPDSGLPWEVVATGDGPGSSYASLAVTTDGVLHVVYRILVGGLFHLFHRTRGAGRWTDALQLTFSSAQNGTPSLSVEGSFLHAVWARSEGNRSAIVYRRSRAGDWSGETRLGDYRDIEANFPTLSSEAGSVVAVWEAGQSLVCRASRDSGSTWTGELPVAPEGGARYPKASDLVLTPDGSASLGLAWSRGTMPPWTRAGGVDVAVLVLDIARGTIRALAIGAPVGAPPMASAATAVPATESPRVRLIDIHDVGTQPAPDERLRHLERTLSELGRRLSDVEERQAASRADVDRNLGDIRSQLRGLGQRLEAHPPAVAPIVPAPPTQTQTRDATSTSTVRFRDARVRVMSDATVPPVAPQAGTASVLSRVFSPKRR